MKKIIALSATLMALSATAFAATEGTGYVALDAMQGKFEETYSNISRTDNGAYNIAFGYQINARSAIELSFSELGEITEPGYSLTAQATAVSYVYSVPIGDAFGMFGRLGYANIKAEGTIVSMGSTSIVTTSDEESKGRTVMGAGAFYNLNETITLRAEYRRYQGWDDITLSSILVGGSFSF